MEIDECDTQSPLNRLWAASWSWDTDTFEQLKPGLSSYDSDAAAAASSLDPLLATAMKTVPEELQVGFMWILFRASCSLYWTYWES